MMMEMFYRSVVTIEEKIIEQRYIHAFNVN